jgi:Ran-binding protein 1
MADSDNENQGDFFDPEEEVGIGGDKKIHLQDVVVQTGEENEDLIFKIRGRLYRWRSEEWKERGTGDIKFLRNKESKMIRMILRQDKTLKAVANFIITDKDPLCDLKVHQESDKMFFFLSYDFSEDQPQVERYVVKLGNAENAAKFKENFLAAREFNKLIKEGKSSEAKFADVIIEKEEDKEKTIEKTEVKTEDKKDEK